MGQIRRADIKIVYTPLGSSSQDVTKDLRPYISSFSYNDNLKGRLDDISIVLNSPEDIFLKKSWPLDIGGKLDVSILTKNWEGARVGIKKERLGCFYIDDRSYSKGRVSIKGISAPVSNLKDQVNSNSYKEITLKALGEEIAKKHGLNYEYNAPNITLKNITQSKETDLNFLQKISKENRISIKVSFDNLFLFEDEKIEEVEPTRVIDLKGKELLSWSFKEKTKDIYNSCVVTFKDPKTSEELKGEYIQGIVTFPKELKVNIKSKSGDLNTLAKKLLKRKNSQAITCELKLIGELGLASGATFNLVNAGKFDGKWVISKINKGLPDFTMGISAYKVEAVYD